MKACVHVISTCIYVVCIMYMYMYVRSMAIESEGVHRSESRAEGSSSEMSS